MQYGFVIPLAYNAGGYIVNGSVVCPYVRPYSFSFPEQNSKTVQNILTKLVMCINQDL